MCRFSIIVPVYRRAAFLQWTINSLLKQRFPDWEAILIDDGSKDDHVTAVLASAIAGDSRFRSVVHPVNRGLPAARNSGLAESRGDYVAFLDSDDLFMPWTLAVLDEVIARENRPAFVAGTAVSLGADAPVSAAGEGPISCGRFADFLTYRRATPDWWFAPSGTVLRADAVKAVGGFWPRRDYCEDIDLWHRLGTAPGFVRISSPATYAYRIHAGSMHHHQTEMYAGLDQIVQTEKQGGYQGGAGRARDRIASIAAHVRHHALEFSVSRRDLAWRLYLKTVGWNIRLGRWKFLIGFPLVSAWRAAGVRAGK